MLIVPLLYLGHREPFEGAPMRQWLSQHWCWAGGGRVSAILWPPRPLLVSCQWVLRERVDMQCAGMPCSEKKKENRHNCLGNFLPTWTHWPRIYLWTKKYVEVIEAITHRCVRTRPIYTYTSGFGDLVSKLLCGFWKQKITRGREMCKKKEWPSDSMIKWQLPLSKGEIKKMKNWKRGDVIPLKVPLAISCVSSSGDARSSRA